jgi:Uma2 family endonuclease
MATDLAPSFLAATELRPDDPDSLYEVINGQIVEKRMGSFEVQIASLLMLHLGPFVRQNGLGKTQTEMLFLIDRESGLKRRPDASFVSGERWPIRKAAPRTEAWDVVPDLAVEVISQSNGASEVVDKIRDYFRAGVRLVWVVYPVQRQVHAYDSPTTVRILTEDGSLDGGEVIPGFVLPLATLFEDDPEPTA